MHEATVGKSILKIVLEKGNQKPILEVKVSIGQAHHVEESSLQKIWTVLKKGTLAENAALIIHRPLLEFSCYDCQEAFQGKEGEEWRCPVCKSSKLELIGGRQMEVISMKEESDGN